MIPFIVLLVTVTVATGVGVAVVRARRRYLNVVVRGVSMVPTYRPGDQLLLDRRLAGRPANGSVVVIRMQYDGPGEVAVAGGQAEDQLFIKRVVAVAGDPVPDDVPAHGVVPPDMVVLRGDGPNSLDSRVWGCVPNERILGAVIRTIGPAARRP